MTAPNDLTHLLGKLGDPLPVQAGANQTGRYLLVESARNGKRFRVLVEASCSASQVQESVAAALAVLCRGRT